MRRLSEALRLLHPDHFRIARAGFWLLVFSIIAKLAGAAREIAIAWRFGRGPEVDAYNLAITLSTWLPLTLSSVLTVVLVPVLIRLQREPAQEYKSFLSELNGASVVTGLAMSCAALIAAPWLVQVFTAELPEATSELAVRMLRSFAPLAILVALIGVFTARLQATHDHRFALAEGLPSLAVVLLILAWQTSDSIPLILGTILGFVCQAWWLARQLPSLGPGGGRFALGLRAAQWRGLWRGAIVMGAGQFAMSFIHPMDQWFAAGVGSGAVATLGFANRLIAIGMALGATAMSRAMLPIFSEGIAQGDHERIRRHALRWAGLMLLLGFLGAGALWLLAPWLIKVLFERGAFVAADTQAVAEAMRWGVWQLPPYFAGLVLVALLASERRYHVIGAIASLNIVVKAVGTFFLVERLGLNGVLLSTVLMYMLSAVCCWSVVWHAPSRQGRFPP